MYPPLFPTLSTRLDYLERKMSAVGLSPLLLFVLCLHLEGSNAFESVHLSATPVKGDPYALNLTWTYPSQGRLIQEHGKPKYFSISFALENRYGCHTVPNATQYGNRQMVEMIRRGGTHDAGRYTLTGLEPNSMYFIYIQGFTLSFNFPESSTYARTGQKSPVDAPTGVRLIRNESTTTSLKFAWDRVPCTSGSRSSPFLAYRYSLISDENPTGSSLETTSAEALVAGLEPYTRYGFRVQFKSEEGYGPFSEPYYAITMGQVSLTQETEVAAGETVELVCRSRGSSSSGIPGPDHLILGGPEGKGQRSSTMVSGLTRINHFRAVVDEPNVEFTCTLHYDGVDEALGTDSLRVKVYEKPYVQTVPMVRIGVPSPGNATVTWLPWTADGGGDGPVDDQEVVWRRAGDLEYDNMAVEPSSVSAVVRGLDPDAEYEFAVVLFRKGIPGPPNKAMLIEGTTTPAMPDGPSEKSSQNEGGYHNLFGPETDNAIIAGVCGIFLVILILLSVIGVWCTSTKTPSDDKVPLTKGED
ncbi:uncharacterized protein LOC119723152 [Patiria miniata]|uniref:Fibronectin type-III domain-containing protein n=1 Tax=Patiria miniata TaxID=46514 RepID=A0A913ZF83_PATMI|nr:uncharacterized protein LOC119723152 [Patiria miniata]